MISLPDEEAATKIILNALVLFGSSSQLDQPKLLLMETQLSQPPPQNSHLENNVPCLVNITKSAWKPLLVLAIANVPSLTVVDLVSFHCERR